MLNQVLSLLRRTRFNLTSESQLQQEISQVFATQNLTINREVRLSERDRPDFMVDGIAIEVKIKGSKKEIYKQCVRYCEHDSVTTLILVTSKSMGFPPFINDKPCFVVVLGRNWL